MTQETVFNYLVSHMTADQQVIYYRDYNGDLFKFLDFLERVAEEAEEYETAFEVTEVRMKLNKLLKEIWKQ